MIFPIRKMFNRKKRNVLTIKHNNARVGGKRHVYLNLGQITTHLEKSQIK